MRPFFEKDKRRKGEKVGEENVVVVVEGGWLGVSPHGVAGAPAAFRTCLVDALVVQQSCSSYPAHECSIGTHDRDNEVAPDEHSKKYWDIITVDGRSVVASREPSYVRGAFYVANASPVFAKINDQRGTKRHETCPKCPRGEFPP